MFGLSELVERLRLFDFRCDVLPYLVKPLVRLGIAHHQRILVQRIDGDKQLLIRHALQHLPFPCWKTIRLGRIMYTVATHTTSVHFVMFGHWMPEMQEVLEEYLMIKGVGILGEWAVTRDESTRVQRIDCNLRGL